MSGKGKMGSRRPEVRRTEMPVLQQWLCNHKDVARVVCYQDVSWMCTEENGDLHLIRWMFPKDTKQVQELVHTLHKVNVDNPQKNVVECMEYWEGDSHMIAGQSFTSIIAEFVDNTFTSKMLVYKRSFQWDKLKQGPAKKARTEGDVEDDPQKSSPAAGGACEVLSDEDLDDDYDMGGYKPNDPDLHTAPNTLGCNWRPLPGKGRSTSPQ